MSAEPSGPPGGPSTGPPGGPPGASPTASSTDSSRATRRPTRSRPVAAVAAAALAAAVLSATGTWLLLRADGTRAPAGGEAGRPATAPSTGDAAARATATAAGAARAPDAAARADGVGRLLAARTAAVADGDAAAFLATVDPRQPAFRFRQRQLFATVRALPRAAWTWRYGGESVAEDGSAAETVRARYGPDAWLARVLLRYRVAGVDADDVQREQVVVVVPDPRRPGSWLLAGDTFGEPAGSGLPVSQPDAWDLGSTTVAVGRHSVVLSVALPNTLRPVVGPEYERAVAAAYAAAADAAVARVQAAWPYPWAGRVVLVVAARTDVARLLDVAPGTLDGTAAITAGRSDEPGPSAADRVAVVADTWSTLTPAGRRVVLTHEVVHVATRTSSTTWPPAWLSEGFADVVGYRGTGVPERLAAADLLAQVRRTGALPDRLPTDADLASGSATSAAYASAYLACRALERRFGSAALVDVYRAVSTAPRGTDAVAALEAVLRTRLGLDLAGLERLWRADVAALVAAGPG